MSLFEKETLPSAFEFDGRVYDMHTDFREWIKFESLMLDEDIMPQDKGLMLLQLIFPKIPPASDVGDFLIWFYSCGKKPPTAKSDKRLKSKKNAAAYSFEYDDGYIYAAFLEQYGIDLAATQYMHWWIFRALFKALHDCKFTEILGYRSMEIPQKISVERKKNLENLKSLYRLPKSLSEQQKIAEAKRIMEMYRRP